MTDINDDAAFQQRFDIARMVLERKYRWAKVTLRNLQPVRREQGTLAVDRFMRLYHGPTADQWTDKEFVGALWHEVNHLLRHHPDRLEHLPKQHPRVHPSWVNIAADLEINDDLRDQGLVLPEDVCYSDKFDHEAHLSAEEHYQQFVDEQEQQEPPPAPDEGEDDDEDDGDDEGDPGVPSGGPGKPDEQGEQDDAGEQGPQAPPNAPDCGSGADGSNREDEEPAPDLEEQGQLEREQRKQDEDVVDAVKDEGGLPPGMSEAVYEAAVERLGKSEHDWRATVATEIRNAMEQRSDEAEEYTFRRRSRRAGISDEFILPGSYRPIPDLGVVVDISGSMNAAKLTASMREFHGILDRLAIPTFRAYPTNTRVFDPIVVQAPGDIERVFERRGGGTNMMAGIHRAIADGCEVVIVLTDGECRWDDAPHGIPVIIGGIDRSRPAPEWARLVDIMAERSQFSD